MRNLKFCPPTQLRLPKSWSANISCEKSTLVIMETKPNQDSVKRVYKHLLAISIS